jgi:anthranilate phosphoribosyltransferase
MSITSYLKEIGRGKDGARALDRAQAADLMGQVLDGAVSDLEVGAFCLAMRVKGETVGEMAGFLDATHARMKRISVDPAHAALPTVVLPSYNGARKLPVLTPLLALLLARQGLPVLIHGTPTEIDSRRVLTEAVLASLDTISALPSLVLFTRTEQLLPGLKRLLDVRRVVGLRNSAHSLVKLMNPCANEAVVVGSYTHPEYAESMAATLQLTGQRALLLRGTEGEPVADARRTPLMTGYWQGQSGVLQAAQTGPLAQLPDLPIDISAASTARYIHRVLTGELPVPEAIACQVQRLVALAQMTDAAQLSLPCSPFMEKQNAR